MSDLTDEELNRIMIAAPARSHLETVAHELLMLRSARAAGIARVREVVEQAAADVIKDGQREGHGNIVPEYLDGDLLAERIADRAAQRLAGVGLSHDDLEALRRIRSYIDDAIGCQRDRDDAAVLDRLLASPRKEVATEPGAEASSERVREVVREAVVRVLWPSDFRLGREIYAHDIADRVVEQLAVTGLTLKG